MPPLDSPPLADLQVRAQVHALADLDLMVLLTPRVLRGPFAQTFRHIFFLTYPN